MSENSQNNFFWNWKINKGLQQPNNNKNKAESRKNQLKYGSRALWCFS